MSDGFSALVLRQGDEGKVTAGVEEITAADLSGGDVLVDVEYSDVNYKDGMIISGMGRLVRDYPHVPGIDFAGKVLESHHERYKPGDEVVLTGWHVGETHWGGYAQRAQVKGDWLVPLPEEMTPYKAMAVGTAGFTSMLCLIALEEHGLSPDDGPVLVTGAAGGVGSVAVTLLAERGYEVVASTGRAELTDYLKGLGASRILPRKDLAESGKQPLESEKWAGAVDTVGSTTLSRLLAQMAYGGSVAACGLAAGPNLKTTVLPFLLRSVNLLGIDSVMQPYENRIKVWERIAAELPHDKLESMTGTIGLADLPEIAAEILAGHVRGRLVVDLAA